MKLTKTARALLGITALAWSIPFAQSAESQQPEAGQHQANGAEFLKLDADLDGTNGEDPRGAIHRFADRK